jgi:hypothetical protein
MYGFSDKKTMKFSKLVYFSIALFFFATSQAIGQSDILPYRNKTAKAIVNTQHLQRIDTTWVRTRIGDPIRDLSSAIERRAITPYDISGNNLIAAKDTAVARGRVLVIPKGFPAATLTFKNQDSALVMVNYATVNIAASDTIPAGATIIMEGKGRFNISDTKTLTFASGSRFDGGLQRRFLGAGNVKFREDVVDAVRPQWWGAIGDSSTASLSGIQRALNSGVRRITVKLAPGTYLINDSLQVPSNVDFIGENATIVSSDTNNFILQAGPLAKNIKVSGITTRYFHVNRVRQPNTCAMRFTEIDTLEVSNNRIFGAPGMGIMIVGCKAVKVQNNWVERTLADGIHITNGLNSDTGRDIWSQDFQIVNNQVFNPGDDGIACVSYRRPVPSGDTLSTGIGWTGSQEINRDGVISGNVVRGGHNRTRGRGISVLGGRDIVIDGNVIEGRSAVGDTNQTIRLTGILIQGATSPFRFWRPNRITISNNIIKKSTANHFGTNFESENGGIKIQGADSIDVLGNTIDWSPYLWGIFVRGDTSLMSYGNWNTTPQDIRIIDNKINNARIGIRLLNTNARLDSVNTRWINRVTIRGNRLTNIQRQGITADSVKTLSIEDNEFIGLNASQQASIEGVLLRRYAGDIVVRRNKFIAHGSGDTLTYVIRPSFNATPANDTLGAVTSGDHQTTLYISEDNIFSGWRLSQSNVLVPTTISSVGLFEYGAVDYFADTLSTTTTFRQFDGTAAQNRARSTTTVSYAADSLRVTNSGHFRVSGHVVAACADSNVTITVGLSQNNATPTDNYLRVSGYLGDSSQFHTIPFVFYVSATKLRTSFKLKFKVNASTHDVYIQRGSMTVERLN